MKDNFASKAQEWDSPWKVQMATTFVNELLKNIALNKEQKALEIGAGTGLVGLQILPHIKSIVFEDTSASMLEMLQQKLNGDTNVEILFGDVQLYTNRDIDTVFSNMAFHHIKNIDNVLEHLFSITTAKAKVIISDLVSEDGSFHQFNEEIPHLGFDLNKLKQKFEKAGFNVEKVYVYNTLKREREAGKFAEYDQFILVAEKE